VNSTARGVPQITGLPARTSRSKTMRSESSITTSLPCQRGVHGPVASVLRGICPYRHAHHGQFEPDMLHSTAVVLLSSVLEASLRLHMSKHRSTIIAVLQVFLSSGVVARKCAVLRL